LLRGARRNAILVISAHKHGIMGGAMTTTAVAVEYVVVGFQVLTWIMLAVGAASGFGWLDVAFLERTQWFLTVSGLAVSYTLGVIFDSFFSLLLRPLTRKHAWGWLGAHVDAAAYFSGIRKTHPAVSEHLDSLLNRIRLLRSTLANSVLIGAAGGAFLVRQGHASPVSMALVAMGTLVLALLSYLAFGKAVSAYFDEVRRAVVASEPGSDGSAGEPHS
jgi:hypothetical protein